MNVRMGLICRKSDWSQGDFRTYWRENHSRLAARAPGLRGYWQNHVTERMQRGIDFAQGPWQFDGLSQLWFDGLAQANSAFSEGKLAADLIADENYFIGTLSIVTAKQREVIKIPDAPQRAHLLKRMSTLKRRPDLSEKDFRHEWHAHGAYVREMPGVSGYRQNVIVARELSKGTSCGYQDLPIDGIVELWFKDEATLEAAFASRQGRTTMAHAKTFLQEITAFVVEEHRAV